MNRCRWCKREVYQSRKTGNWVTIIGNPRCVTRYGWHPHLPEANPL